MTKKHFLLLLALGLAAALLTGVLVFSANVGERSADPTLVIREFVDQIAQGNLPKARAMLSSSDEFQLRSPTTALSEAVYRELQIIKIEHVIELENDEWMADVTFQTLDTLQMMTKANYEFWQELNKHSGTELSVAEQDSLLEKIYDTLLERDDLPTFQNFCIVTLKKEAGDLKIVPDKTLMNALEGNISDNANAMNALMQLIGQENSEVKDAN